jgi:hypothetical protein
VRFNFGHQGVANKALLFWTLTDKGREQLATTPGPIAATAASKSTNASVCSALACPSPSNDRTASASDTQLEHSSE